jgi:hypothetical protein
MPPSRSCGRQSLTVHVMAITLKTQADLGFAWHQVIRRPS